MKCPIDSVLSEINSWFESHGYQTGHVFVVNDVTACISSRISEEDQEDFKKKFGESIYLNGASMNRFGEYMEFEYSCDHQVLAQYRNYVYDWVRNHNFPLDYIMFTGDITLYCNEELSKSQILDFEEEFEVNLHESLLKCYSNQIEYIFY